MPVHMLHLKAKEALHSLKGQIHIEFIKKMEYLLASVAHVLRRGKCAKYYSHMWWYTILSLALRETLQRFTFPIWLMTMHVVSSTRHICI